MLFLHRILCILVCLSAISTTYLYLYPIFHGCAFPTKDASFDKPDSIGDQIKQHLGLRKPPQDIIAPFRLLALGDPQLEGDSSLWNPEDGYFPALVYLWKNAWASKSWDEAMSVVGHELKLFFTRDVLLRLNNLRKEIDLVGNDYYLAHIYRSMHHFMQPTHVSVLGDLLGSQWVTDEEFERRSSRFWNRVFKGGKMVEDHIMNKGHAEMLGSDPTWNKKIINIVGNHDVGYAGDMSEHRIERFERHFGKVNWETKFFLPRNISSTTAEGPPSLRLVIFNSMNLDGPAKETSLQTDTYTFLNDVIMSSNPVEDRSAGTLLLTHIPIEKQSGICVDAPYFAFYGEHDEGSGLKEQYQLSYDAGKGLLEGIFGMHGNKDGPGEGYGRHGIIVNGHDHEGCDVYHHLPHAKDDEPRRWKAERWEKAIPLLREPIPGIREITLRSMMGEFGGSAGLLSAWFDFDIGEWQFAFSTCAVGKQHIWWLIHILDLVTLGFGAFLVFLQRTGIYPKRPPSKRSLKKQRSRVRLNEKRELSVPRSSGRQLSVPRSSARQGSRSPSGSASMRRRKMK
jgi:hypothetical protein